MLDLYTGGFTFVGFLMPALFLLFFIIIFISIIRTAIKSRRRKKAGRVEFLDRREQNEEK